MPFVLLLVIFSDYIGNATQTWIWPLLGFIFMPLTTLAYAFAWHMQPSGQVSGLGIAIIVVAALMDLSTCGGSASNPQVRAYYTKSK